jgi:3',5'-cyclic-AMP phosphodiesterase
MIGARSIHGGFVAATAVVIALSCARPAENRARAEADVGHAASNGARIDVDEGAAAVRELADGSLRVWASVPSFTAHLHTGPRAGTWRIVVENAMPGADVAVAPISGQAREQAGGALTERIVEIDLPADTDVTIRLAPKDVPAAGERFRFLVYGDVQDAIDRVQDIYRSMNAIDGARFAIIVGDLTEQGAADQLERFRVELKSLRVPCYATVGNHELGADDPPAYYAWYGRATYGFTFGDAAFTLVDSASATVDPTSQDTLDALLGRHRDRLHLVGMHIPPVDPIGVRNGAFASHAEAQRVLSRLAHANVDLTVYGHVHSYYAFENAGIPAFITGGGGAIPERFDAIGRHYLVVDADPVRNVFDVALVRVDHQD